VLRKASLHSFRHVCISREKRPVGFVVFIRQPVRPSACLKFDIEDFIKIRRENTNLVHFGQKCQALYIKTMTALYIAVTIVMFFVYVCCMSRQIDAKNYYYYYYYYYCCIIIFIHFPYITAVWLVLKTVRVPQTRHFLFTALSNTFSYYSFLY
jgi:hypothetical protein